MKEFIYAALIGLIVGLSHSIGKNGGIKKEREYWQYYYTKKNPFCESAYNNTITQCWATIKVEPKNDKK